MPVYKIALIGDGGVGKTAIRERYLGKGFTTQYVLTIGADFAMRDTEIDGVNVRYQIWDLAGQKRFDTVRAAYYRGCVGGLLVYDITRTDSFYNTPKWINELWSLNGRGRIPIIVVANKLDMRAHSHDTISPKQGEIFTERLTKLTRPEGFMCHFIETSARTGVNIGIAFNQLGCEIINFIGEHKKNPLYSIRGRVTT